MRDLFCPVCLVLIIVIIWFWYMEIHQLTCVNKIYMETLLNSNKFLKTGDIILFKATDTHYSIPMFNYFTHVGIVVIDKILTNNEPYIFEAVPIEKMDISRNRLNTWNMKLDKGILFAPLNERLKRYRGYTYYKSLNKEVSLEDRISLINFIFYALNNMEYDYNVIQSGIRKTVLSERCNTKTNCGEIVFLSLIHMNLLDHKIWCDRICPIRSETSIGDLFYRKICVMHYLKWMCNITKLNNGYMYRPIVNIVKMTV